LALTTAGCRSDDPNPQHLASGSSTLFAGLWTVEEGQWWIGTGKTYGPPAAAVSYSRLIESEGPEGAVITVPNADGKYRTVVRLLEEKPAVPEWCQDAGEVSIHLVADPSPLQMGSDVTRSDPILLHRGWYRVRYCAERQDLAARQDATASSRLRTFAGRHLIQLWPDRRAPDRTLRTGSAWAQRLGVTPG